MLDMNEKVDNLVLSKGCNIRPYKGSEEFKRINLSVKFHGITLHDVFQKALSGAVISWQNGPGRRNFDKWNSNQTIELSFSAPGRTQITFDPVSAAAAEGISVKEYLERELAKYQDDVDE